MSGTPQTIGPYRILRELGRGGMGVVYLAVDPRLDRKVAIKVLPPELAQDPHRLARFEREAKSLAQLTHPNVAGIHGIEDLDGAKHLVLEFVEGESLAERLDRGPLPIDDAIDFGVQITRGISAAHDAGVIHRDLKPANVMVTPEGTIKILDFGLARMDEDGSASSTALSDSPTLTSPSPQHSPTIPGAIMGTAAYMSPEQARGRRVDRRADVWAFGVILYEMLVGASPFRGETASDSIGAVLHKSVDLDRLPPGTPRAVGRTLERCLARDKEQRYRDINDVRIELTTPDDEALASLEPETVTRGSPLVWIAAVVLVGALAGAGAWFAATASAPEPVRKVRKYDLVVGDSGSGLASSRPVISPDGSMVAYVVDGGVLVREVNAFDARVLEGAEEVQSVIWSPDSRFLACLTKDQVLKAPARGGSIVPLATIKNLAAYTGGAWLEDGRILVSVMEVGRDRAIGIFAISSLGGSETVYLPADLDKEIHFHEVRSIPGTDVLLLAQHAISGEVVIQAYDGERRVDITTRKSAFTSDLCWSPTGHVLYSDGAGEQAVWAAPFSLDQMKPLGDPFLVQNGAFNPSVSNDGTLLLCRGEGSLGGDLVWISRAGQIESIIGVEESVLGVTASPDGSKVMYSMGPSFNRSDVWIRDLARGVSTRLTYESAVVIPTSWSPDGNEIAVIVISDFASIDEAETRFYASDGSGQSRDPIKGILAAFDSSWTRAAQISDPMGRDKRMFVVPIDDPASTALFPLEISNFMGMGISPDGSVLAYISSESGEAQLFCTRFPSGKGKWQVSSEGASQPFWSTDGSKIQFLSDGEFFEVDVTYEPALTFGIPRRVFDDGAAPDENVLAEIAPSPDGDRFLAVLRDEEQAGGTSISVIENWFEPFRLAP